jgi:hypothetical protein
MARNCTLQPERQLNFLEGGLYLSFWTVGYLRYQFLLYTLYAVGSIRWLCCSPRQLFRGQKKHQKLGAYGPSCSRGYFSKEKFTYDFCTADFVGKHLTVNFIRPDAKVRVSYIGHYCQVGCTKIFSPTSHQIFSKSKNTTSHSFRVSNNFIRWQLAKKSVDEMLTRTRWYFNLE